MKILILNWKDIEDDIRSIINISVKDEEMMETEGIELIIPRPYLRRIPSDRNENLKKARVFK